MSSTSALAEHDEQVKSIEGHNLQLESELQLLKLALDHERAERRHYHSLANEIITRLDVVGQTIDGKPRAELPEVELPTFLKKVEALANGHGEKEALTQ